MSSEGIRRFGRDSDTVLSATLEPNLKEDVVIKKANDVVDAIKENPLFRALGITTKVTILNEKQSRLV